MVYSRYILAVFSRALKFFWVGVSPRCYCMDVIVVFQCLSDIRVMNSDLDWCKRGLQFLQCHAWVITGWVLAMLLEEFWKVKPFLGRFIFLFFFFGDNGSHCVSDFCPNVLCFHMLSVFPCPYLFFPVSCSCLVWLWFLPAVFNSLLHLFFCLLDSFPVFLSPVFPCL